MCRSQVVQTVDDKMGELEARSVFFEIRTMGDTSDPKTTPFVLSCIDADDETNRIEVGRFYSVAGAQREAQNCVNQNRATSPTLTWES